LVLIEFVCFRFQALVHFKAAHVFAVWLAACCRVMVAASALWLDVALWLLPQLSGAARALAGCRGPPLLSCEARYGVQRALVGCLALVFVALCGALRLAGSVVVRRQGNVNMK
jgi:hypothetical protein